MDQKPTIGRIVHFYDEDMRRYNRKVGPYAAVITEVHEDETIDLDVFGQRTLPSLLPHTERVKNLTGESHVGYTFWWVWPPRT